MNWATKSAENLLPLSINQSSLMSALKEWLYTGDMFDLEEPSETCELCEHPDIRYQFKIVNRHTGNELLVGSECINKFGIAATDELGNVLNRDESRKRVNRDRRYLVDEARKRRLINTLVSLAHADEDFDINSFITYEQDRHAFTPKQLSLLFWRLAKHNIEYSPRDFKLTIRRDREKSQLRQMEDWQLEKLRPAMSTDVPPV